ncbi:MAG: hypothetical protein ACW992_12470 [Candidatus Thorarchaeota archaeon]|jgi:hypothetical protein
MKSARQRILVTFVVLGIFLVISISNPAVEFTHSPELHPAAWNAPAAVVWSDDFTDGNMDGWTTWAYFGGDANFSVDDGIVYSQGDTINIASHPSDVVHGTWSFDILIGGHQVSVVTLMTPTGGNGYDLVFAVESHQGIGSSSIQLQKDYPSVLLGYVEMDPSGWHHIIATRDSTGYMCIYADGTLIIEAVDNSVTSSDEFGFAFEESAECAFDNVSVSDSIDMDEAPPRFLQAPTDQTIQFGEDFFYKLNATDYTGIASWTIVEWTTGYREVGNFAISSTGLITNLVDLAAGDYELEVTVSDTLGNSRSAAFVLTVEETFPAIDPTLLIAAGGVTILVVVLVIFLRKRG